ncbi:histidine phosphatase family protein [Jiangella muralis]|uniref:histidine phosphatase family protein n=1 Tax=Jiangella muralis TaxID=702383 RepID=UPI00069F72C4|nr:histidine phosphatase family protein [Jiangella muralis]
MTLLLLVRHGETDWNAERRLQGREDRPLSARGRGQARALAPYVARYRPDHVTCSPLLRTRQTAHLLGVTVSGLDPRWQEADLGSWTGRTREELVATGDGGYAAWRAGSYQPPGAEPLTALRLRVAAAIDDLAIGGGVHLVVTHGGPIRAACHLLVALEPAALVPVPPGSLTVFDLGGPRPRLRAFNVAPGPEEVGDSTD